MLIILKDDPRYKQISSIQVHRDFPKCAYVMVNSYSPQDDEGVLYPPVGDLYAVADEKSKAEFFELIKNINEKDICIDVIPLETADDRMNTLFIKESMWQAFVQEHSNQGEV